VQTHPDLPLFLCQRRTGPTGLGKMKIKEQLANALRQIELQQCLARLVATGQIKTGIKNGDVVYWHDEDCVEAYEALDPYCQ
jgi:hypothetical protein